MNPAGMVSASRDNSVAREQAYTVKTHKPGQLHSQVKSASLVHVPASQVKMKIQKPSASELEGVL